MDIAIPESENGRDNLVRQAPRAAGDGFEAGLAGMLPGILISCRKGEIHV